MIRLATESAAARDNTAGSGWFGPHRISVVIPALNEEKNVRRVLQRIPVWVHEVILVDGESTDCTIEAAVETLPSVRIVRQGRRGKGDALRQGFSQASGDVIVMLDADGSTDPFEMPVFIGALLAGADFAKGTRFGQGGGSADLDTVRALGNSVFTLICRLLFRNRCTDLCYGYNAFWAAAVPKLKLDADGFEVETQMSIRALRAGLKVVEVPSYEARRHEGVSKLRPWADGWRVLRTLGREWYEDRGFSRSLSRKRSEPS